MKKSLWRRRLQLAIKEVEREDGKNEFESLAFLIGYLEGYMAKRWKLVCSDYRGEKEGEAS